VLKKLLPYFSPLNPLKGTDRKEIAQWAILGRCQIAGMALSKSNLINPFRGKGVKKM